MVKNQIKSGAVLSYIQLFLGVLISIIIHPIIINKIGISENGIFHMAINAINCLNLLTFGLGSTFIRFYTKYHINNDCEGENKLNGLFLVMYIIIAIFMGVFGGIIINFADKIFLQFTSSEIQTLKIVMTILLVQSTISLVASVFTMNINAKEKFVFAKTVGILSSLFLAVGKVVLVSFGYKAIGLAIITIVASLITIVLEGFYAIFKLKIKFSFKRVEKGLISQIFIFSFFIFLNQIIDAVNWQIDSIILGIVQGTTAVAVYSMASVINSYVLSFSQALSSVLVPKVNRLIIGGGSKKEVNKLFALSGRIQFIVLAVIMLAYIFFGKAFIVNYFANEQYLETYYIGLLLILPLIVPLIQNVGVEILRAYNMHKFRSVAYLIMAIINLIISIPLGKYYGGIGCAIGTAVSLIVGNGIIMNIYYYKKADVDILGFWKGILRFIPALILPIITGSLLMIYVDLSNICYFVLSVIGFILSYAFSMYFVGLTGFEREQLKNKVLKIKQ